MKYILLILSILFIVFTESVYRIPEGESPATPPDRKTREGWLLWQKYNCQSCHQIYGLGGYMGPDLTNVVSQKGTDYMRMIIRHGTRRMPDFGLSDQDAEHLITFLQWVNQTGQSKVPDSAVHWTGTYQFNR